MATTRFGKKVALEVNKSVRATQEKVIGLAYPFKSISKGYARKQSGAELIKNNIIQLMQTSKGERVMLPQFGTNLADYLFEPLDSELSEEIRDHIVETMALFMPRVKITKLIISESEGISYEGYPGFNISLQVVEKDTNQRIDVGVQVG